MTDDAEVDGNGSDGDDKTVKKIIFQKVNRIYRVFYLLTFQCW